jgi:hypothetical protein
MTSTINRPYELDEATANSVLGGLGCAHIGAVTALGTWNGLMGAATFLACEIGQALAGDGTVVQMSDVHAA